MLSEGRLLFLREVVGLAASRVGFVMRGDIDGGISAVAASDVVWQIRTHIAHTAAADTRLDAALSVFAGVLNSLEPTRDTELELAQRLVELGSRTLAVHLAALGVGADEAVEAGAELQQ
jgi:hypothetical protein